MKNIVDEIKDFLSSTGLKQCLLAKEARVSTATINRIYKGKQLDVMERRANSIRAAMSRLSTASPISTPEPASQKVSHAPEA